jgi:hypothetical protein
MIYNFRDLESCVSIFSFANFFCTMGLRIWLFGVFVRLKSNRLVITEALNYLILLFRPYEQPSSYSIL